MCTPNLAAPLLVVALLSIGCTIVPPVTVIEKAEPNPFLQQKRFAVEAIDFTGVRVGDLDEARYLSGKDPEQQKRWTSDKTEIGARFLETLIEKGAEYKLLISPPTGPSPKQRNAPAFLVQLRAVRLEPGYYAGITQGAGSMKLDVSIKASDGHVLDHIVLQPQALGFSVTQRFSRLGTQGGALLAGWLYGRSEPVEAAQKLAQP